jgi:hypothetical protein
VAGASFAKSSLGPTGGKFSPQAPRSSRRSLYRPFQGDEERKGKCNDSGEGDGKVNVVHGDTVSYHVADQDGPHSASLTQRERRAELHHLW